MNALSPKTVVLLGVPFHDVTMNETLAEIDAMIAEKTPRFIATANLDFAAQASRDVELQRILLDAHLVLCDGTPLVWTSRWLHAPLRERVAGSDLTPRLAAHAAARGYKLFFLGSDETVLREAKRRLEAQHPGLEICGVYAPPYAKLLDLNNAEIAARIRAAKPDILLVALGAPKQEKWISMHHRELGVPVSIGIGASLDFVAGKVSRAPQWMHGTGLEWVYRLQQEPRRLFARYAFDARFFVRALASQAWHVRDHETAVVKQLAVDFTPIAEEFLTYRWSGRADAAAVRDGSIPEPAPVGENARVFLDLSGVTFMDSTGLGLILKGFKKCKQLGGTLVLVRPSAVVLDLITTLKLTRLLPVAQTMDEAENAARITSAELGQKCERFLGKSRMAVRCRGELNAATAGELFDLVQREWTANEWVRFVKLDLSELHFIDSAGVECLLRLRTLIHTRRNGWLSLAGANANVRNVLNLAHLEEPLDLAAIAA